MTRVTEEAPRPGRGRRAAGRPLALPRWWLAVFAAFLLVVVAVVVVVVRTRVAPCRDELVGDPHDPMLTPARMQAQPDARLDRLASAVGAMGPPFGEVVAGVGYDYGQWLHLYGVEGGVLAFTKDNAPVTLLDAQTLRPRWALRPASKRIAWDADARRFLLLDLSADSATHVSAYSLKDGHRAWCASVGQHQAAGQPVATTFLDNGGVVTALPDGKRIGLTLLSTTGTQRWARSYDTVGRADFVGPLSGDRVLVGGMEEFRLADQATGAKAGPVITAVDATDGRPAWSWDVAADSVAHVVGTDGGRAVVVERGPGGVRVLALSDEGKELWSIQPQDAAYEATLRGGVVVTKSRSALSGYDDTTGRLLWTRPVPTDRTYFPYGFTLGQMPSLDDTHVLVPTTTDLVVLDVRDGSEVAHPIPVDGISTTYWPYQLMATPDLLGVVTNTGGVVARRTDGG